MAKQCLLTPVQNKGVEGNLVTSLFMETDDDDLDKDNNLEQLLMSLY